MNEHLVEFYEADSSLVQLVRDFMAPALLQGQPAIIVATPEHREMFAEALERSGIDPLEAQREGRFVALDAAETLARFMSGSRPDPSGFFDTVGGLVSSTRGGGPSVQVYGEMVALLWAEGNDAAAIELEELWNELACRQPFHLLCAYPTSLFDWGGNIDPFWRVCGCHSGSHITVAGSTEAGEELNCVETDRQQGDINSLRRGIELALQLGRLCEGVLEIDAGSRNSFGYKLQSPRS
jgi:hypothetical protein